MWTALLSRDGELGANVTRVAENCKRASAAMCVVKTDYSTYGQRPNRRQE
jgi:hypothetical protein